MLFRLSSRLAAGLAGFVSVRLLRAKTDKTPPPTLFPTARRLCLIALLVGAPYASARAQNRFDFTYSGAGISVARSLGSALLSPPPIGRQLLAAMADERRGAMDRAEREYADAVRMSNDDPAVGLSYAQFLARRGKLDEAGKFLTELQTRRPDNAGVLAALAQLALTRRDWAAAQKTAKAIRDIGDPQDIAYQIEGAALIGQGKVDDAIAVYQKAVTAAPSAAQPMALLVSALVHAKKADRAMTVLQSALKANPNDGAAYVLMGTIQRATGKPDEARRSFKLAIDKQPENAAGYLATAQLDIDESKIDDAIAVVQAGLRRQPKNMMLHMALSGALERAGRYEAAIAEYEKMLKMQPGSLIAVNNLASLLSDRRTDKPSLERAQKLAAVLRGSQVPQFMDTLGWVSYRNGNYKVAVPLLTKAAAALPDHVMVRYHLGMAFLATRQAAQAEEQLKAALALKPDKAVQEKIQAALAKLAS